MPLSETDATIQELPDVLYSISENGHWPPEELTPIVLYDLGANPFMGDKRTWDSGKVLMKLGGIQVYLSHVTREPGTGVRSGRNWVGYRSRYHR